MSGIDLRSLRKARILLLCVAAAWLVVPLPVCSHPSPNSGYGEDIARILQRGTLIVAMYHEDNSPYFMHDQQGRFTGWDVDMARDIAARLGVEPVFDRRARTYNEVVDLVARGEADIGISQLSRTLQRATRVLFTRPYLTLKVGMLINRMRLKELRAGQHLSLLETFNSPRCVVAVRTGTVHEEFAHTLLPKALKRDYPDWTTSAVQAVIDGEVTVGLTDETGLKEFIMARPEAAIHITTALVDHFTDEIAMIVPLNSTTFRDWLNIYIDEYVPDLNADLLLERYSPLEAGE